VQQEADRKLNLAIDWGLTDLYQKDGLPVLYSPWAILRPTEAAQRPVVFYSTQYERGAEQISIRDLTSGKLWTETNSSLTDAQVKSMVRPKDVSDWTNRLRIRPEGLPWIDLWWRHVEAKDAIPNPDSPGRFWDLEQLEQGLASERTFDLYPFCDLSARAGYKQSDWTTIKGTEPDTIETSHTPFAEMAMTRVFPGYAGPNKVSLGLKYERSHIHSTSPRGGAISSATVGYSLYPEKEQEKFIPRSTDIEFGVVRYLQEYDPVHVHQRDVFAGITVREIFSPKLDLSTRYTVFEEEKEDGKPGNDHRQACVSFAPLWRLVDNENAALDGAGNSPLRFVNLALPLDYQYSRRGPSDFENYGWGMRAEARIAQPGFLRTSMLVFAELTRRNYFNLDKTLSLYTVGVKIGF